MLFHLDQEKAKKILSHTLIHYYTENPGFCNKKRKGIKSNLNREKQTVFADYMIVSVETREESKNRNKNNS